MASDEHLQLATSLSANDWNKWRRTNGALIPDFAAARLDRLSFRGFDLSGAVFRGTSLQECNLIDADCHGCDFANADLTGANLRRANLQGANFEGARMTRANLRLADLTDAVVTEEQVAEAIYSHKAQTTGFAIAPPPRQPPSTKPDPGRISHKSSWAFSSIEQPPAEAPRRSHVRHSPLSAKSNRFDLVFDPTLTPHQVKTCLQALADYFRACGGLGLRIDLELQRGNQPTADPDLPARRRHAHQLVHA